MLQIQPARIVLILLLALLLAGCGSPEEETPTPVEIAETPAPTAMAAPATPTPVTEPVHGLANVDSVEVLILESFPVQIHVSAQGFLPDSCTQIDDVIVQQEGQVFDVAMTTVREPGQVCAQALVPFEESIPLDVLGLPAGTYTVAVNGVEGSFTLDIDNVIQEEGPPPVPVPTAEPLASITGQVWHDLCAAPAPGAETEAAEADPGCVTAGDALQANGLPENEPGIEGVQVALGQGPCPAAGLGEAITNTAGDYAFDNLAAGTYCVSIDAAGEENRGILLAGEWTAPAGGVAESIVTLGAGDLIESVDFGWDYLFLPAVAGSDPAACVNSFAFVEDLNIPDDTAFPPGGAFTKRWLLFNNGTCPWTADYSTVFVGGDLMSAEESTLLAQTVVPGQDLEVAVAMVAPDQEGFYRSNWQFADAEDEPFGINGVIEDAFFLRIVVDENAATPAVSADPNSGTIGGVVWDDFCLSEEPGNSCLEAPEGSGFFIGDGTYGTTEQPLSGITSSLASIACPAGGLPPAEAITSTTLTGEDGLYRFENLATGAYCIFMDALSDENVNALIPGNWTYPATGVGRYSFFLDPGEQALDLDFGWDYVD
jgi:uncharacterized protein (DUF2141 family)